MKPIRHIRSAFLAMILAASIVPFVHAGPCYRGGWGGGFYRGAYYRGGWGAPVTVGGGAVVVGAALSTPCYYPYGYTYAVPASTIYIAPQTVVQQSVQPQPTAPANQLLEIAQTKLAGLGYFKGSVDGIYGVQTSNAVVQFQSDNNLPINGRLDLKTLSSLGITP
jgi:hypothetical protein